MSFRGSTAANQAAGAIARATLGRNSRPSKSQNSEKAGASDQSRRPSWITTVRGPVGQVQVEGMQALYESIMAERDRQVAEDREFLISAMQSSPTKRGAKQWLRDFGPAIAPSFKAHRVKVLDQNSTFRNQANGVPLVAIVKIREPQSIDDVTLKGIGRTLSHMRMLGLLSILLVDCGQHMNNRPDWLHTNAYQIERGLAGVRSAPNARPRVMDYVLGRSETGGDMATRFSSGGLFVERGEPLLRALKDKAIVVVPTYTLSKETSVFSPVNADEVVVALIKYLMGVQPSSSSAMNLTESVGLATPEIKAAVKRVILIDPLGGPPANNRPGGAHVFLNMAQEYEPALKYIHEAHYSELEATNGIPGSASSTAANIRKQHSDNLELTRRVLALLPSSASVLITTPEESALLKETKVESPSNFGFLGLTGTRKPENSLLNNLLSNRPLHSSSLPMNRFSTPKPRDDRNRGMGKFGAVTGQVGRSRVPRTTLAQRGMPLTMMPDPRISPWVPRALGEPRPRLTDLCVDLPRLVHLIENSFKRKLDVQHYLDRVNDTLAGIIIVGEYEGGAILTWEAPNPHGLREEEAWAEAYQQGRLVPYLDKFAVLQRIQGEGGAADVVFNAMVRMCFPGGVCWRSRKNNPVNKWYAERSSGFRKLPDSNWSAFWTTEWDESRYQDYEDVCRRVQPSWADNKPVVD